MENKRKCDETEAESNKKLCRPNTVTVERLTGPDQGIVLVGIDRAEARNALDSPTIAGLQRVVREISEDRSVRCVLLQSQVPGVFSAGADLKERLDMSDKEVLGFLRDLNNLICSLECLAVPVLAAVDGPALGGGLELLLGCDMIVSSERAVFGLPETRLGVIPGGGGTVRLGHCLGWARAARLVLSGHRITGQQAEQWGLVAKLVTHQELELACRQLARDILLSAPLALKMAKFSLQSARYLNKAESLELEAACYADLLRSRDRREGLEAWSQHRPPSFNGE